LLLATSMGGTIAWAVLSAVVAVALGFSLSVPFDLPSAPAIIAVQGFLVLVAWLVRRARE
jgi:ABC-type Mn2+/Zn2+ transport system permease subunit